MRNRIDQIRQDNYKQHLEWFNLSIQPVILTNHKSEVRPLVKTTLDTHIPPETSSLQPKTSSLQPETSLTGQKRQREIADLIDLTDSQPKRTRDSPTLLDMDMDDFVDQPFLDQTNLPSDNDLFDDDFGYEDAMLEDTIQAMDHGLMDLEETTTPSAKASHTKEELQMLLVALKEQQNQVNNSIVEGLANNATEQTQKQLLDERQKLVDQIRDIQLQLEPAKEHTRPQHQIPPQEDNLVVLDEEDNSTPHVSPFFQMEKTTPQLTTSAASAPVVAPPIVAPPVVAPPVVAPPTTTLSDSQTNYPWSRDVRKALTQNFKLADFRPNQLEAINTTLKGEDVFVLMPTGGGKSLCYQLPAIIQRFDRQGVTFVVSPLLSLMQDQVHQLVEGKGIAAGMLNSTVPAAQKKWVFSDLAQPTPTMQLLYITPELLNISSQLRSALDSLYRRNKLARFVIDEAHCVSQWGHDFRPDYKQLGFLKQSYPNVPIMALTATANEAVQKDVLFNLKMNHPKVLKQSFNRTNLIYQIVKKSGKTICSDMNEFIRQHPGQSGIIYCTTRNNCEQIAETLRKEFGVSIKHYHAAMPPSEKATVQREWQTGQVQVIAATIAFGMGIDKPDVRFVLHHAVPSSLEGYYQETGRAGRDGLPATCRLYYSFADTRTHNFLIDQGDGSWEQKQRQRNNLNTMVRFCDNQNDCRRKQIMGYFGERFDPAECRRMCDNCINSQHTQNVMKDMSQEAIVLLKIIQQIQPDRVTFAQLVDIFRGSKNKRIVDYGLDRLEGYGHGKSMLRTDVDRLMRTMMLDDVIREKSECNARGFPITQVFHSTKTSSVLDGTHKILVSFTKTLTLNTTNNVPTGFVSAGSMVQRSSTTATTRTNRRVLPTTARSLPSSSSARSLPSSAPVAQTRKITEQDDHFTQCLQELKKTRQQVMAQFNLRQPGSVLTDTSLRQIAEKLPLTDREFLLVTPMRPENFVRFGQPFLKISIKYHQAKTK
ncbi:P-loop containing nucleoside triphosphate hydrolase protein [Blakeslea trispora]|nr:P-loop containing nucleoside triphosphate hydrolase protein [Blakeslea trispora]